MTSVFFRCSLSDSHLSQSRLRYDHRVNKRSSAAHLPHLLRHACRHDRLLCIPDQVSQGFLSLDFSSHCLFFIAQILWVRHWLDAILAFHVPQQTEENNKLEMVMLYLQCTYSILIVAIQNTGVLFIHCSCDAFSSLSTDFSIRQ